MRRLLAICVTFVVILIVISPAKPGSLKAFEFSGLRSIKHQIKWEKRQIPIALSSSLNTPGPNLKLGSDILGAARRALARWAAAANITFVETSSTVQSISTEKGDGISLITIADTRENNAIFSSAEMTGRTRVFYDPETGTIAEADISINPHPALSDGSPVQFSTDGTAGTYDLESTFTHEIGHLLGLDHSAVMAATMQARQGLNGVFGLPAFTGRTLSEEDRERVRSRYGPRDEDGGIEGRVTANLAGAQVWAEQRTTGKVVGASAVSDDGSYRIEALIPGDYRILFAQQDQFLNPRFLGINGELSSVALPLEAGKSFRIYLGGEGLDEVSETAISVVSPFFKVEPGSLIREQFGGSFPVVSLELRVAANVQFGDYSIRLQSNSGEVAYLTGAITIDPGVHSIAANPVDDPRFFVRQHYRDVLGREPDPNGLEYWASQLEQCGSDMSCIRLRRLAISNAFFAEDEFQHTGSFVYGLYKSIGRRPAFTEFNDDRKLMDDTAGGIESKRQRLALDFVARPEFAQKYSSALTAEEFVDSLVTDNLQKGGVVLSADRAALITLYDGGNEGRAAILSRLVASPAFVRAEQHRIFVLMQYFAYLRRDADEAGYNSWVNALQTRSAQGSDAFRSVACAFLNSKEYESRFGIASHPTAECAR